MARFFLGPGAIGPIGSVFVADEDLLEIFSTDEPEIARSRMLKALPRPHAIRAWLTGDRSPWPGRPPEYVGILAFLCWMQTTVTRVGGERDFRVLLGDQLGENFRGAKLVGLNAMWEHLRDYLKERHEIELLLPGISPHRQIGRTLRIAFPTWRDRDRLRRIRASIPADRLLDPLPVSNRIRTSRDVGEDPSQSFDYNFDAFDAARLRGGRDYEATPFWRAWYPLVAETAASEGLVLIEGAFGEIELYRTSPIGDRIRVRTPEDAIAFIPKPLARLVRQGAVFLASGGFGRYVAIAAASNTILMKRSRLEGIDPQAIVTAQALNAQWIFAAVRADMVPPPTSSRPREFGWRDGIRVGNAFLGRTPLAPRLAAHDPGATRVERDGQAIEMVPLDDGFAFPQGVHAGSVQARALRETREIRLVANANEIGPEGRLGFDPAREFPDDEAYHDTVPVRSIDVEPWERPRAMARGELTTLGEALYARSARGLAVSDAIPIVSRCLGEEDGPSPWDVLRAFADAGWLEGTLLRHFPARRLLQRTPTAERVGPDLVRIGGPTPLAVLERLDAVAEKVGAHVRAWDGSSEWAPPRYTVRCPDASAREEFLERAALAEPAPRRDATVNEADAAEDGGVHGYDVLGKFDEEAGHFAFRFDGGGPGLFRLARPDSNSPKLYRSVVAGSAARNYVSPYAAFLAHGVREGRTLFEYGNGYLRPKLARVRLPCSWARSISDRTLCNPAPALVEGKWRYRYPIDAFSLAALRRLVPIDLPGAAARRNWTDAFVASASNRRRAVHDVSTGRTRVARGPLGGR